MNTAYILAGTNLGDRPGNLQKAKNILKETAGKITTSSRVYETAAWGNTEQPDFYNQLYILETALTAQQLMKKLLTIEEELGRVRTFKNASRLIDLDILFFNNDIINQKDLVIPHPEIANRRFVLTPLNELSPVFIHPVLHKTISELLAVVKDTLEVKPLQNLLPY